MQYVIDHLSWIKAHQSMVNSQLCVRPGGSMDILKDLGFAFRTLRKSPAFAATSLVTIALGIGASTAIFSVVNAVLLRPLPYANRDRLVIITNDLRNRNVLDFPVAAGDVFDIRQQVSLFDGVAAIAPGRAPITGDEGPPELINTVAATTNLFQVLGARVVQGRDFIDDDGVPPPPPPPQQPAQATPQTAPPPLPPIRGILSYQYWQSRF